MIKPKFKDRKNAYIPNPLKDWVEKRGKSEKTCVYLAVLPPKVEGIEAKKREIFILHAVGYIVNLDNMQSRYRS
jgi:hypothetical protein